MRSVARAAGPVAASRGPAGGGPRFTFFGGKGGVGKTTCAAAAAVRAATEGARVLVVSTDPAHSLADALELELGAEARPVRAVAGELFAAELDADRALGRWMREREDALRTIASRGTYLDDDDIERLLSLSLPGVDELVGLVELLRLSRGARGATDAFDHVVVDTAPTGHTLRLLEMPDTLGRLAEVLDDMHEKHRFLAASLGGAWRPDFADEAIAAIEEEAVTLRALLRDHARASFTWVTLPEELSFREAEAGIGELERAGMNVEVVVVNRVWPGADRACAACTSRIAAERTWRVRAGEDFGDRRVLEVPARDGEPRGAAALLELASSVRQLDPRRPRSALHRRGLDDAATIVAGSGASSPVGPSVRLALFGGKGGVGKTTVAASSAIALAEARPDDRVLLLSTDPAHSLGDALGAPIGDEARPVPGGPPNLEVRELDAARAWDEERRRYREAIDGLFAAIFRGRMDATFDRAVLEDLLDLAPPGIDELTALVALLDAVGAPAGEARQTKRDTYELVVVDTAPTGHTLRLLALPDKALAWVHALMSILLKYRSVIGLGELAGDLTRLATRLRALSVLLADPARCAFVIVTRAAALPRLETERLARELRRLRVPLSAIVANAVASPSCGRCRQDVERQRPELARLERLAFRAARSARLITAPAVHPGPRGVAELRLWRDGWVERGMRAP